MKNINFFNNHQIKKTFLFISLFIISFGFSQDKRCIIYFKDNTKIEGLGKLKTDGQVKFRLNQDSEKKFYDHSVIDKVEINEGKTVTYKFKKVGTLDKAWLEVLINGKVCLYTNSTYYNNPGFAAGGPNGGFGGMTFGGGGGTTTYYYVEHTGDDSVFKIATYQGFSKSFKKTAADFFKDCPIIVEKVTNGSYKKDDLEEIVNFYNSSDCGKTIVEKSKTEN